MKEKDDESIMPLEVLMNDESGSVGLVEERVLPNLISEDVERGSEEPGLSGSATDRYFRFLRTQRYEIFLPGELESRALRLASGKTYIKNRIETFVARRYAETWCGNWKVGHLESACQSCNERRLFFEEFGGPEDLMKIEEWSEGLVNSDVLPLLLRRFESHDAESALTEMCERNQRLVVSVAKHSPWRRRGFQMLDLVQYGNLGLINAAIKFNLGFGNKFATYAIWWIRQAIDRECLNAVGVIRLPVHVTMAYAQISSVAHKLGIDPDNDLSADLIAPKLATEPKEIAAWKTRIVETVAAIRLLQNTSSLDRVFGDDSDESLMSIIPDRTAKSAEESFMEENDHGRLVAQVRTMMDGGQCGVDKRSWIVLAMRYGLDGHEQKSLRKVAASLKLSPERVRQIETKALHKLRRLFRQDSP